MWICIVLTSFAFVTNKCFSDDYIRRMHIPTYKTTKIFYVPASKTWYEFSGDDDVLRRAIWGHRTRPHQLHTFFCCRMIKRRGCDSLNLLRSRRNRASHLLYQYIWKFSGQMTGVENWSNTYIQLRKIFLLFIKWSKTQLWRALVIRYKSKNPLFLDLISVNKYDCSMFWYSHCKLCLNKCESQIYKCIILGPTNLNQFFFVGRIFPNISLGFVASILPYAKNTFP